MSLETFRDYVEAVRSSVDIAQVVGEVVSLRKSGRGFSGLCPFHQEKSPSFNVDPVKGLYYCFGCGAGGDAFRFVMQIHNVDFPEAVQLIGDKLGLARPAPRTPREAEQNQHRSRSLKALESGQAFFAQQLEGPVGGPARGYLARRGFSIEAARRFGLGFAPAGWDGLLRHLSSRSFSPQEVGEAGLIVPRSSGSGFYDRFRNRITFPIRDTAGRLVSFGGRAMEGEEPKYLNGPETPLFDKGRTLFRLFEEAQEIRKTGRAIVVEGYFDAVGLALAGIPGVVAVCGTALGPAHARLLRRYAEKVVLFFDGDQAGRRAVRRALAPLLAEGLTIRIATPPEGKDPDDLARDGGPAAVEEVLGRAEDVVQFLVDEARRQYDLTEPEQRVKALEMILGYVVVLNSNLARAEAAARVADGLGIEDQLIRQEIRRAAQQRSREVQADLVAAPSGAPRLMTAAEGDLIRFLCGECSGNLPPDLEAAQTLLDRLPPTALGEMAREAVLRWREANRSGRRLDLNQLAEALSGPAASAILALAFAVEPPPDAAAVEKAVAVLEEQELRRQLRQVQEEMTRAGDPTREEELIQRKHDLAKMIQRLAPRCRAPAP